MRGEFLAGGDGNQPVYIVGDLQATTHDPNDLGLTDQVAERLETEGPGGQTLIQTGDLVTTAVAASTGRRSSTTSGTASTCNSRLSVGNHETYNDLDYNSLSTDRTAIFSNMYALPKNGVVGESNYSFDRGDIHFSVLNSNFDLDQQLAWLENDVRASTATWNVVVGHFSYYGGKHGDDPRYGHRPGEGDAGARRARRRPLRRRTRPYLQALDHLRRIASR